MNDPTLAGLYGGVLLFALALPVLCLAAMWIGAVIDVLATKREIWVAAGQCRLFCLLLLAGLGPVGAVIYGAAIRPSLARMQIRRDLHRARRPHEWAAERPAA